MLGQAQRDQLVSAALLARGRAVAPYSKFAVGAALLDQSGETHLGCNIENASLGLTICAERVAAGNAIAAGKREWTALAVASLHAAPPCGACRQVLAEFAPELVVLLVDADSQAVVSEPSVEELLPQRFGLCSDRSGDTDS